MKNPTRIQFFYFFIFLFVCNSCYQIEPKINIDANLLNAQQKKQLSQIKKNYYASIFFPKKECEWEKARFFQHLNKQSHLVVPIVSLKNKISFWGIGEFLVFYLDSNSFVYKQEYICYVADERVLKRNQIAFLQNLGYDKKIVGDYTGFFIVFDAFFKQIEGFKYFNGKKINEIEYELTDENICLTNPKNRLEKEYIAFFLSSTLLNYSYPDAYSVGEYLHTYLKNIKKDSTTIRYNVILYLYEPAPNSSIGYFFVKIGHVYIALEQTLKDDVMIRRSLGFWPSDIVHPWHTLSGATLEREDWQKFTIKITIPFSEENFFKFKHTILEQSVPMPIYDLENYNCIDWISNIFKKNDIILPTCRVSWGFGSASATGVLGYQLRQQYIQKKLPKNWLVQFGHFGLLSDNLN